jgi:2-dehydropantoate 2-reductase
MARIAIVGVGAIGGALASLLESTGRHEITLCTRRPLPELVALTPKGKVRIHARNLTKPAEATPVDWVLVATKAYDAEGAAAWFPGLCAEGAPVAIVQNGVEHRERFAPWVSEERLLPVVIDCPCERKSDGEVHVRGTVLLKVEDSALGRGFLSLFEGSGANLVPVEDFTTAAWWKLCMNSVGALNALSLQPVRVLWSERMTAVSRAMAAECLAVARAEGARLDDSVIDEIIGMYRSHPADSINSLLADRLAGRRMESDARNGAVVRKGRKHGIPTPMNELALALLEAAGNELPFQRV